MSSPVICASVLAGRGERRHLATKRATAGSTPPRATVTSAASWRGLHAACWRRWRRPIRGRRTRDLLLAAAHAVAAVGGTTGPLWGTGLLRAADAIERGPAAAVRAAADGIAEVGGAQAGDRTMLDALLPAVGRAGVRQRSGRGGRRTELRARRG